MTPTEQRRWLRIRQQWAKARLHDADVMVIGADEVDRAREDLAATTALLKMLDSLQLELFAERTQV